MFVGDPRIKLTYQEHVDRAKSANDIRSDTQTPAAHRKEALKAMGCYGQSVFAKLLGGWRL